MPNDGVTGVSAGVLGNRMCCRCGRVVTRAGADGKVPCTTGAGIAKSLAGREGAALAVGRCYI
jgi:hypothetical protein